MQLLSEPLCVPATSPAGSRTRTPRIALLTIHPPREIRYRRESSPSGWRGRRARVRARTIAKSGAVKVVTAHDDADPLPLGTLRAELPACNLAFGDTIADLVFGQRRRSGRMLPAAPLVELVRRRARYAPRKRDFYSDNGINMKHLCSRDLVSEIVVGRICSALSVHPPGGSTERNGG